MKSQKGITLISVSINVIVLLIMVAMISTISTYFFANYNNVSEKVPTLKEYTNFISYFSQDINIKGIRVLLCETTIDNNIKTSYIIFNNNVQYTFLEENRGVYRNKIKIARNVSDCEFLVNNEKNEVTVYISFVGNPETKEMTYTIKN